MIMLKGLSQEVTEQQLKAAYPSKPKEGQYLNWIPGRGEPTKAFDSGEEALKEAHNLSEKTGQTVYLLKVFTVRYDYGELVKRQQASVLEQAINNETLSDELRNTLGFILAERFSEYV